MGDSEPDPEDNLDMLLIGLWYYRKDWAEGKILWVTD